MIHFLLKCWAAFFLGAQFKTIVEYAPSQRAPKPWSKKDGREGTIFKGIFVCLYCIEVLAHTYCLYVFTLLYILAVFFFFFSFFSHNLFIDEWLDPEYLEFLDRLAKPVENLPSAEIQLERKEAEERAG